MAMSVRQAFGHGAGSLERTRSRMGIPRGASVRQMAGVFVQDLEHGKAAAGNPQAEVPHLRRIVHVIHSTSLF